MSTRNRPYGLTQTPNLVCSLVRVIRLTGHSLTGAFTLTYSQDGGVFVVKLRLRERESIQEAVRRFRKLVEHSGIKKEMRRREFYEKPSDKRRRARRRAERRARMARMPVTA